jgi:hypothetical protein
LRFIFSNFLDIKFLQNYGPKVSAMKTKKKPSKNTTFYFCGKKEKITILNRSSPFAKKK